MLTDLDWRFKNQHHFFPAWGSYWGIWVSCRQKNCDSSDAHVTCINCSLSMKTNVPEMSHGAQEKLIHVHEDHGRILLAFISTCVVCKNSYTSNLSFMADSAITQGGIGGLGSPFQFCDYATNFTQGNYSTDFPICFSCTRINVISTLFHYWTHCKFFVIYIYKSCKYYLGEDLA